MADNERQEFSKRLNFALDKADIPPKGKGRQLKLASMLNVSQESARKWLSGEGFPDTKRIIKLSNILKINAQWLLSGIGNINQTVSIKELPLDDHENWISVPYLTWEEAGTYKTVFKKKIENSSFV